jgi:hypothetical protein
LLHPVVPCPPGGGVDVIARSLQEPLAKALGPSVAVDNRGAAANRPHFCCRCSWPQSCGRGMKNWDCGVMVK